MSGSLSLNGTWGLAWAEGAFQVQPGHLLGETVQAPRMMEARVPSPIHRILMEAGLIEDIYTGLNSLKARWVEEMVWVYRHTFTASEEAALQHAWLTFDRLELDALIFLNGQAAGRHANANRPAVFDVTGILRPGENLLTVRISSGMHTASDKPVSLYSSAETDLLTRRPWLRKPQYQCGWDWNPRLVNVGILGDVRLEWRDTPRLSHAAAFAVPSEDLSRAVLTIRAFVQGVADKPVEGRLRVRIEETGQEHTLPIRVPPGESRHEIGIDVANPRLWWPIHQGEQNLYHVEIALEAGGETQTLSRRTGIRKVEIDQSRHPVEGRYFIIRINDRPVFCKGGNWVPADLLYSEVGPERYRELVSLAREANFNTLRIWGGGPFADHALLDACDEMGLLVWHDFLFACSKYPGQDADFVEEVRREVTHAVRDLTHHPSLAVWCGNNEIEWGDAEWYAPTDTPYRPHHVLFSLEIPRILAREDPSRPYWFSSPHSPEFQAPNDPLSGDQHPWSVSITQPGGADGWRYRAFVDRFPNEGGVLGATSPATLCQFIPPQERYLFSPAWNHHDNPFACMDQTPGELGHAYETVRLWTGRDPLTMRWESYLFASAILQAEGLQEYIHNYRRRMFSSASAIFWMYNDSWPVSHGWTIVDYYLRKKLAFHPVRRAFRPVTVVAAEEAGQVSVFGINDTAEDWQGELRFGLFSLTGGFPFDRSISVRLPANSAVPLASFERALWESGGLTQTGAFALLMQNDSIAACHRLFLERFKALSFAPPEVEVNLEDGYLSFRSNVFVWGVCLDVDGEAPLPDNCFDLLPDISYRIPWHPARGIPSILRIGSRDAVCT